MRSMLLRSMTILAALALPILSFPGHGRAQLLGPDPYFSSQAATLEALTLIPTPPQPGSANQAANVQLLNIVTSTATPQMVSAAWYDSTPSVFDFSQVLGPGFTAEKLPVTNAFFTKVITNIENTNINLDKLYHSQGPVSPDSYPSAHTLLGFVDGVILADMIPEKKDQLLTYGVQFGLNRLVLGAHWPTDVTAGQMEATLLLPALYQSSQFMTDFERAKAEVRTQLGYK
ncbi:phosphatase PAP2 family protein [Fundidesulfovibrio agrisoli]|uniref:phosphatase PAP2 family protein n=1 Tax=Fundidesulfovibrio agrisoli TaxID=2922717 RepID=UPI001FABF6FC|nr:phosphatase PAP2 family protein [Fundidesulfovibrio agrisoli]